jgi:hypothetical protein
MKDEFDDVTSDMFERGPNKKVARPVGSDALNAIIEAQEGSTRAEKVKNLRSRPQPGGQLNPLNNIISRLDEEGNRPAKAPAKPVRAGGGSSGVLPNYKSGLDRPHLYKKGGKVAGKLATRGYGISKHGKK